MAPTNRSHSIEVRLPFDGCVFLSSSTVFLSFLFLSLSTVFFSIPFSFLFLPFFFLHLPFFFLYPPFLNTSDVSHIRFEIGLRWGLPRDATPYKSPTDETPYIFSKLSNTALFWGKVFWHGFCFHKCAPTFFSLSVVLWKKCTDIKVHQQKSETMKICCSFFFWGKVHRYSLIF